MADGTGRTRAGKRGTIAQYVAAHNPEGVATRWSEERLKRWTLNLLDGLGEDVRRERVRGMQRRTFASDSSHALRARLGDAVAEPATYDRSQLVELAVVDLREELEDLASFPAGEALRVERLRDPTIRAAVEVFLRRPGRGRPRLGEASGRRERVVYAVWAELGLVPRTASEERLRAAEKMIERELPTLFALVKRTRELAQKRKG